MSGHFTCLISFWRYLGLWICWSSEYDSRCLNDAWICLIIFLDMPEHDLILLNAPEYVWKCWNKLSWLCPEFSRCFIILDIWSAGCTFKCQTIKMKLAKNKKWIINVIFYQILILSSWKFIIFPFNK